MLMALSCYRDCVRWNVELSGFQRDATQHPLSLGAWNNKAVVDIGAGCNYIRQVNGVNWRDIMWCFFPSVLPPVCAHTEAMGKEVTFVPRTFACEAIAITTTLRPDRGSNPWPPSLQSDALPLCHHASVCNGIYTSLNARATMSQQNNDFYFVKG